MKQLRYIFPLLLAVMLMAAPLTYSQSLLDGKKWTTVANVGGSSGSMQGAAYYNGKVYQFTDKCAKYGIYDIATNTWSAGSALNTGVLANCHFGSACFGPESTKTYTVGGVEHTSQYPLLFVTGHDKSTTPKAIVIYVIDLQLGQVVTQLRFEHTDNRDDKIAAYDFEGGKIYIFGYPVSVMEGHTPYTVWTYSGVNFNTFASESVTMSPNLTGETNAVKGIGGPTTSGPNAGIQENLACGTLQDCHYHNGYIYYATSRGSEYNRTEFAKVHALNVSTWKVEKTLVCNNASEPEGFVFDPVNEAFYMTCGGAKCWKLSAGSGYDANNYQPATPISGGTYDGYYEITSASQFVWFKSMVYNGCTTMKAYLAADIDMAGQTDPFTYYVYNSDIQSGTTTYKFEAQFAFRGIFDGNGHTISNVNISSNPYYNDGLFPYVMGATIKNLTVEGNIKLSQCRQYVYDEAQSKYVFKNDQPVANVGLIGYMDGGTLENVNAFITIDQTVAGVDGTVNKLIGTEGAAVTKTNCLTEDPSKKSHAENGGEHLYMNGICVATDAVPTEDGYYQTPSGGGTAVDPYQITNAGNLYWFAKHVNAGNYSVCAKLMNNINLEGGKNGSFPVIGGNSSNQYKGVFDGQGYSITNFMQNDAGNVARTGMFACVLGTNATNKAIVKNFTISGTVTITGTSQAMHGVIVGEVQGHGVVEDVICNVNYVLPAQKICGGIAGSVLTNGVINRCTYGGEISGSGYDRIGGIVGEMRGGTISNCLFTGSITCNEGANNRKVGGIAAATGNNDGNVIKNCYSHGAISMTSYSGTYCGHIFGYAAKKLTISDSYYTTTGSATLPAVGAGSVTVIQNTVDSATGTAAATLLTKLKTNGGQWLLAEGNVVPGVTYCTIIFQDYDGTELKNTRLAEGDAVVAPADPTREGHSFAGWSPAVVSPAAGDATYTATYSVAGYDNGFNTNAGCAESAKYQEATLHDGYYIIENGGQLFWFAHSINGTSGLTKIAATSKARLSGNINLDCTHQGAFPGIGTASISYTGTFDGQGHTISDYLLNCTTNTQGFFPYINTNAVIKDFTLTGTLNVTGTGAKHFVGAVVGRAEGNAIVQDVTSTVAINVNGQVRSGMGGVVGCAYNNSTVQINRCRYNGIITVSAYSTDKSNPQGVAGICGNLRGGTVSNCLFDGTIKTTIADVQESTTGTLNVGGIIGCVTDGGTAYMRNCFANGTMSIKDNTYNHCGILYGYGKKALTVSDCYYTNTKVSATTGTVNAYGTESTASALPTLVDNAAKLTSGWLLYYLQQNAGQTAGQGNWVAGTNYPLPGVGPLAPEPQGNFFTITFNDYDDSLIEAKSVLEGNVIEAPTASRTGYTFTGWTPALAAGTTATKDATYKATYSINSYTLTYYIDGVQDGEPDVYEYGAEITPRANPTKAGYEFSGWSTSTGTIPATMPAKDIRVDGTFSLPQGYTNGFNNNWATCAEDKKYEAATLVDGYYEIDNGGKLFWLANQVNANGIGTNINIHLTADINMDGTNHPEFVGICTDGSKIFIGTFDGQGHKITNFVMSFTSGNARHKGLFGYTNNATIKDFTISGAMTFNCTGDSYFNGAVVGRAAGTTSIEDVHSSVAVTVKDNQCRHIGGIAGVVMANTVKINRCRYSGAIVVEKARAYGNAQSVGGIIGEARGITAGNFTNCLFDGTLTTKADGCIAGGLIGAVTNNSTLSNCMVNGTFNIYASDTKGYCSQFVGCNFKQTNNVVEPGTATITIKDSYYTGATQRVGNSADGKLTETNVVERIAQPWSDIRTALGTANWLFETGVGAKEYPVPGEFVCSHTYNQYGYCTVCGAPEPIGEPVLDEVDGKSYYHIDHLADLGQFRNLVNTSPKGTEINAKVTADIDITALGRGLGELIGNADHPYVGTYDGQGHKFVGLNETSSERYVGIFNVVGMNGKTEATSKAGTVKNFSVYGTLNSTYFSTWNSNTPLCMGVVGQLYNGTVENVHSYLTYGCTTGTKAHIGGVVGGSLHMSDDLGEAVVKNCSFSGTINVNANDNIGGIIGYAQHKTYVSHCLFDGKIIQDWTRNAGEEDGSASQGTVSTYIGGILGYTNSTSNGVQNCLIVGTMESNLEIVSDGKMHKPGNNINICVGYDGAIQTSYKNYHGNFVSQTVIDNYHQYPTTLFSGTARIRSDEQFATGEVCAELNADENLSAEDNPWGQILGYQVGAHKDPGSPAQKAPFPGYTDPGQTSYKVVRTANAENPAKYDYTADYYYFDDLGDATPYPSDAASMEVKKVEYKRVAKSLGGYISVCFPFPVEKDLLPEGAIVYDYDKCILDAEGYVVQVDFKEHETYQGEGYTIAAGDPVIVGWPEDASGNWDINIDNLFGKGLPTSVVFNPAHGFQYTYNSTAAIPAWEVSRTSEQVGLNAAFNTEETGIDYFKLNTGGEQLVYTKATSHVYPYRTYIKLPDGSKFRKSESSSSSAAPRVRAVFNRSTGGSTTPGLATALDQAPDQSDLPQSADTAAPIRKYFINNQLVIERAGHIYTATGVIIK